MARKPRNTPGGYVYHVLNRSAGRITLFRNNEDYAAFERVMLEAHQRVPLHILAWCLMKNHWHFVVRPRKDDEVTAFFRWLAHTHAMRSRVARNSVGWGHLYQGRFKAFPVQSGHHLREVRRYVERNALSAGVVPQAQDWRWGSLWVRCQHGGMESADRLAAMLKGEGVKKIGSLPQWVEYVNAAATKREPQRLALSTARGQPFGDKSWVRCAVGELGLEHTIRPEGRPLQTKTAETDT